MKKWSFIIVVLIIIVVLVMVGCVGKNISTILGNRDFVILTNPDNVTYAKEIVEFGKENNINVTYEVADDLEAIDMLKTNSKEYDAVWLSNSTWIYMLNGVSTLNSKSININPVVFGIKKSKAESLGFVNKNVYNKDIVNAIRDGKLSYVMSSVTKTNTGLIAYLGFLNALAGSPELLTSEMLKDNTLRDNLISLFSGVKRVSGDDNFLQQMFLNSDEYEAVIATESALININKQLESSGKEPLYLLYPLDGVAINDSPFAYIDNKQDKLEEFNLIQQFLLNKTSQKNLEDLGKRTWYGGINLNANKDVFKKSWGIDTSKYLMPLKYPSKSVIDDALDLYIDVFRKPSATVFCLDYSGSMYGDGESQLESAMAYILDYERAKDERIQFSQRDKIHVLTFSDRVNKELFADNGRKTQELINGIYSSNPRGGTNLYGCAQNAIQTLSSYNDEYTKTVILMTDGEANVGSFYNLESDYYNISSRIDEKIPIYSIMFGNARESQLDEIAELSNAKVFDGRSNLIGAFKEVRSFN